MLALEKILTVCETTTGKPVSDFVCKVAIDRKCPIDIDWVENLSVNICKAYFILMVFVELANFAKMS